MDKSTTPTVLDTAEENDRVETTTTPSDDKILYNLEDGSKIIHSGDHDPNDADVCAICLEPYGDHVGKQVQIFFLCFVLYY